MHTAAGLLHGQLGREWAAANILTGLAFTAVPLFLMMSGYLLLSDDKTLDVSVLLKKRIPRLLVPLVFWTFLELLRKQIACGVPFGGMMLRNLWADMVSALSEPVITPLWYMYTLLAIYLISPLLRGGIKQLDSKGHRFVLCLILLINLRYILLLFLPEFGRKYLKIDLFSKLEFFGGHLCTFVLGYYLGNTKRKLPNWLLLTAVGFLAALIIAGTYIISMRAGEYQADFQNQSHGLEVLLASCVFLLFKQNADKPCAITRVIAQLSLPMYLMHGTLYNIFCSIGLQADTLWQVLLLTVTNFAVCYLITKTLATIKPLCYPATGMRFEAASRSCNWIYSARRIRSRLSEKKK